MSARILHLRLQVLGTGCALPGEAIDNAALLQKIQKNFSLSTSLGKGLAKRLGVNARHHSRDWLARLEHPRPGDRNPELAAKAVLQALQHAGLSSSQLQYLLGHTTTPARLLPPNIAEVAQLLKLGAPYAELRQACTGFANALQWAAGMLTDAQASPVAIVGSEVGSVFFDPEILSKEPSQWVNLMQMGDGAGAIVLGPADIDNQGAYITTLYFGHIGLDKTSGFSLEEGGSDYAAMQKDHATIIFQHHFTDVKKQGLQLFQAGLNAVHEAGVSLLDIKFIIPHQANGRIGQWLAKQLNMNPALFYGNAERVGNLGSASIWVALHELRTSGLLQSGDRVLVLGAEATQYMYGGFVYVHG